MTIVFGVCFNNTFPTDKMTLLYAFAHSTNNHDGDGIYNLTLVPTIQLEINRYVEWQVSFLFLCFKVGIARQRLPCFDNDDDLDEFVDAPHDEFFHVD